MLKYTKTLMELISSNKENIFLHFHVNLKRQITKRTTPGIPTWSPTVVLTGPDDA
jgi:hypothetical protein